VTKKGYPEEKKRHAGEPYVSPDENRTVTKTPIAVTMNEGHKLDRMSGIDFGKPFSVEWNVKVRKVG
jgi:hypothetical protein